MQSIRYYEFDLNNITPRQQKIVARIIPRYREFEMISLILGSDDVRCGLMMFLDIPHKIIIE